MTTPTSLKDLQHTHGHAAPKMGMREIATLDKKKQFPAMLEAFKREIALALPSQLTPERMARLALTAFNQNPKLADAQPSTVFASVLIAAQLGLEIGVDGQAYIVPYYDNKARCLKAQLIPGWKGLVQLVNNAKEATVWTGAVFKGDRFDYALGDSPHVKHQPTGESDETKANLLYVYAVGRVHDSHWPVIEVWPLAKVQRHLDRYNKQGDAHYAKSNDNNFIQYGRKVALLQVLKYMPKSAQLRAAEAIDAHGQSAIDLKDVLEGEWSHVAADAETGDDAGQDSQQGQQAEQQRDTGTRQTASNSDAAGPSGAAPSAPAAASEPSPEPTGRRRAARRIADPE